MRLGSHIWREFLVYESLRQATRRQLHVVAGTYLDQVCSLLCCLLASHKNAYTNKNVAGRHILQFGVHVSLWLVFLKDNFYRNFQLVNSMKQNSARGTDDRLGVIDIYRLLIHDRGVRNYYGIFTFGNAVRSMTADLFFCLVSPLKKIDMYGICWHLIDK